MNESKKERETITISCGEILKETGLLKESLRHVFLLAGGLVILLLTILSYYQAYPSNTLGGFIFFTAPAFILASLVFYFSGEQELSVKLPELWTILRGKLAVYEDVLIDKEIMPASLKRGLDEAVHRYCCTLTGAETVSTASMLMGARINPGDKFYIITKLDGTQIGTAYPKGKGYRLSRWLHRRKNH